MRRTIGLVLAALVAVMLFASGSARAQAYPAKPVRVVVVFPPGGATDIVARLVFQKVGEQLNQQFLIDNRAGAAGMIGGAIVAKSPADGYTLMVYSQTLLNNMHIYRKVPFDAMRDFVGIAGLTRIVGMLAVPPAMPVRSTKELIALAKARPAEIYFGTAGSGAYQHLATTVFANMAGIKITHVPYKGGAPAVVALMSGDVQMIITPIAEVFTHVKAGRLRPIAVSSEKRTTQFPDVPAIAETLKGYEFNSWFGAFAPAGTPSAVVDKLSAEIKVALAHRDVLTNLSAQVLDPSYMTPGEFAKHLRFEFDRMRDVIKLAGVRID